MSPTQSREHAHELIDRMAPGQVPAVVGLLEIMLDPLERALACAPFDDEPVSEQESRDAAVAKGAIANGESVSQDELLALALVKVPDEKVYWEQFFLMPAADMPQEVAVAAAIDGRGDR